jgi:CubicO group peptidase (beta-lactamase class C family)
MNSAANRKLRRERRFVFRWIAALVALSSVSAIVSAAGPNWPSAAPESAGIDSAALNAFYDELSHDAHADLKGIVILRNARLVSEHYFNGDGADTLHDIRSATKSITSALMGIALERGYVRSVDDPIADYLPNLPRDGKEKIRIRDLLTMRSGLDADDTDESTPGNESNLDQSSDWIKTTYSVPVKRPPGEAYLYCSINAFLVGAIVENAAKMPLDEFARKNLFEPLGIAKFEWRHIPVDRTTGQGNLRITARDAAAIGELFLQNGKHGRRQIVSPAWVERSLASEVPISAVDRYADFYGYMWYTKTEQVGNRTVLVHFASGNGGNKIYIVPSLNMVLAITSSAYNQGYGQKRSQEILLKVLSFMNP